jgi:hypothetical protein
VGCTSVTYSKDPVLDFERYPRALVTVTSDSAKLDTDYLAAELDEFSGFSAVTTDVTAPVDLVLDVALYVDMEINTDSDGNTTITWSSTVRYVAWDAETSQVLDEGTIDDEGGGIVDVSESALDELVLRYHRAFRL